MNRFLAMTAWALAGVMLGGAANATCTVYEHWDFQGEGHIIQNNDYVRFVAKGSPEDRHLPARPERTFWEPTWYNRVSSVELTDSCQATFFMTPGNTLTGHQNVKQNLAQFSEDLNDKTDGIVCVCPE